MKAPAAALVLLLITACSTTPTRPPTAAVAWESWLLAGRIAVRQADEGWHGGIRWDSGRDGSSLQVTGPLGGAIIDLSYGAGQALMRLADGQVRYARDARTLLREMAGLDLPLEGLHYWVQGHADPVLAADLETDADGNLKSLRQAGWWIRYDGYRLFQGQMRPTRVQMTREDLSVKLVLKSWQQGRDDAVGAEP